MEPILAEPKFQYTAKPIVYDDLWALYQKAQASYWVVGEVDLSADLVDWKKLDTSEQHFVKHTLAYFAPADGVVNENLVLNFQREFKLTEIKFFYSYQAMMENIHNEMYSDLIDSYVPDAEEKERLFDSINTSDSIQQKTRWAEKHFNRDELDIKQRLIAFACVEGIFFSSSFASIFWLKSRGLMPGLTFSNELISRDEALHVEFACALYNKFVNRLSQEEVYHIVDEAIDAESAFVDEALPDNLVGINKDSMKQYVRFVGDFLLTSLGYSKKYHVSNPFPFMNMISNQIGMTNFFEKKVSAYSKAGTMENKAEEKISFDSDF